MNLLAAAPKLEIHHVQALVRAMHALSLCDGVHDAERVMLRGFYDACQAETQALTSFDEIVRVPLDEATLAETFPTPELQAVFLHSCLFLGFADGRYSDGERQQVQAWAAAMGVAGDTLASLEDEVADHLMQQIARIENTDALQEVATTMRS